MFFFSCVFTCFRFPYHFSRITCLSYVRCTPLSGNFYKNNQRFKKNLAQSRILKKSVEFSLKLETKNLFVQNMFNVTDKRLKADGNFPSPETLRIWIISKKEKKTQLERVECVQRRRSSGWLLKFERPE